MDFLHPSRQEGYVLNVDGSCLGASGRTDFGGLIRRGDGSWIIGFSGNLPRPEDCEKLGFFEYLVLFRFQNNFGSYF
jgi:hypothetical protein